MAEHRHEGKLCMERDCIFHLLQPVTIPGYNDEPKASTRHRLIDELTQLQVTLEALVAGDIDILPDDSPGIVADAVKYLEKLK